MNNNDELQMQVSPICNKNGDYRHLFITRYLIIFRTVRNKKMETLINKTKEAKN